MIDLSADMDKDTISSTMTMQAFALQDLDTFHLDLEGLDVTGVTVDGADAHYTREGNELVISPPNPLREGQDFTTIITYGGKPATDPVPGTSLNIGWVRYDKGVYVASEPSGAQNWYPVNNHPCDKATYAMRITVPKPYVVAANGLLRDTVDNGTTTTYVWETEHPVASYLVTVNIAEFAELEGSGPNNLPMRSYVPSYLETEARDTLSELPQMIEYFSGIFGPYPFEAYGVVVTDDDFSFALETQTMSLFSRDIVRASQTEPGRTVADFYLSHELAHQWFGDSVSLKTWKDIWLNEGFATYGQWLWAEHKNGRDEMDQTVRNYYQNMIEERTTSEKPSPPGAPPPDRLFNRGVYYRGALTLHALRLKVGDDAFFRTLQTYTSRYRDSNASTQDFINVAEEVSGQQLEDFFQAWLYDEAMPGIPEMGLAPESTTPTP
jgi:aminopeptidase N